MKATIYISLKNGVLDPQGKAIENALNGFDGVENVRQGKMIELELADTDANQPATVAGNVRKAACQYRD